LQPTDSITDRDLTTMEELDANAFLDDFALDVDQTTTLVKDALSHSVHLPGHNSTTFSKGTTWYFASHQGIGEV